MSETPVLRDGPPWAMEEMIAAEPGLVEPIFTSKAAGELAELVDTAVSAAQPVTLVGCGSSEHAAMAGAAILNAALGSEAVSARDAFEASLDPPEGGALIGISHEAGTAATQDAVRSLAGGDVPCGFITARPTRAPDSALVFATPLVDLSWCHTVGYLSPVLALHAVAAHLTNGEPDSGPAYAATESVLERRGELRNAATRLARCDRMLMVGSGVDGITALELALKIEEGTHVPVTPVGLEKVLHGHLPAVDAHTGLVLIRADQRAHEHRDARADDLLKAISELDMPSALIELPQPPGLSPVSGALIAGAIAAQVLTLELVHLRGTNPDLIRREEEPYRRAAAVAEGG